MMHLAMSFFNVADIGPGEGIWLVPAVGAIAVFAVFLPMTRWIDSRRKEREAYYRAETLRRVAEAQGEGAKATLELLWEENRQKQMQAREGLKIGGVITLGVGIALMIFLRSLGGSGSPYLVGLIPCLVGVAMLVYVYLMAPPIVDRSSQ
jgi:hypothetical protein